MTEIYQLPFYQLGPLFEAISSVKVIKADQDGPPPPKPYITMKLTETQHRQMLEESEPNNQGFAEYNTPAVSVIELECYGPGAKDTLDRLTARLRLPRWNEELNRLNISFNGPLSSVDFNRVLMENQTEERAMQELRFGFTQQLTEYVGTIKRVIVRGEFDETLDLILEALPPEFIEE